MGRKESHHAQSHPTRDIPVAIASATFLAVIAIISVGLTVYQADLHLLMLLGLIIVTLSVIVAAKASPMVVLLTMSRGIWRARTALVFFALIGIIISTFIRAGTVPTLIDWGVKFISPQWFLPAALLVCSVMSIATGTAWGTAGTIGVILIGLGATMSIPAPLVAGVVVSGACFGDKMSPVSDTTNLAAMSAGVNLYRHIRSMAYTTAPTFLIVLIAYTVSGFFIDASEVNEAAYKSSPGSCKPTTTWGQSRLCRSSSCSLLRYLRYPAQPRWCWRS